MIYCVVPEELSGELYDRLNDYYAGDPNVKVIVDRRKGDRRARLTGPDADAEAEQRQRRDRRRARVPGEFPPVTAE